jgi:RNA polymerase sigma factor (sigma-70 family)
MAKTNHRHRSELLVRCVPMLRTCVRHLVADREAQHDLLQELILTILSDPSCPEDMPEFAEHSRAHAHQLALRELADTRAAVLLEDEDMLDAPDPFHDPERTADTREELSRAIDRLNDDALRLLVRRYVLEENANELARDLSQTPAAMRVRLMRLRSAARGALR